MQPEGALVVLSHAGSDPGAVMVELSYALPALIAMFGPIFLAALADGAIGVVIEL